MSQHNSNQTKNSFSSIFFKLLAVIQRIICICGSFNYKRYRQLSLGNAKALVTARGIAVILPSAMIAGTLSKYGPAVFGLGETVLLVAILPLVVFAFDYSLVAHSYTGTAVPQGMNIIRILILCLSISLNVIVVAGANSGSLLPDIEKELRSAPYFSAKIADLQEREKLNAAERRKFQVEVDESDNARKKLSKLNTLRDAEIAGATLTDGVQRVRGQGTKANGYILEINEANQIAAGGDDARKNYAKATEEANSLNKEREAMEAELKAEVKRHQTPGAMVTTLLRRIYAGDTSVLITTLCLLFVFIVADIAALGMAHMPTPPHLLQIAGHISNLDVAKSEFDHEVELSELNSKRPRVDIRVSPGNRYQNASAKIFNMRNEASGAEAVDERMSA